MPLQANRTLSEGQRALFEARPRIEAAVAAGSCVLSAPTGTGKSTEVVRWLSGRVLVVEPRRVACQALARRVAELSGVQLGQEVGYRVRDDDRSSADTRILYATPGIVLQDLNALQHYDHVVLDEFHERRLDTDWLYAQLKLQKRPVLVMSATIDAGRIAEDVKGTLVEVHTRAYPVDVEYLGSGSELPEESPWQRLVHSALRTLSADSGDVLVFLPGRGEIQRLEEELGQLYGQVIPLYGALPLEQQARVFAPSARRKIILATNVAETSLTLPGVRVVVDSGLARSTLYHGGRTTLALVNIAADSAAQRMGRAGRTGPGQCFRLWGRAAQLRPHTAPQIHREDLTEFVLWSAVAGQDPAAMPCLDAPKPSALQDAQQNLRALGAIDDSGAITERGRQLHRLPLDPWFGRVLVEAQVRGTLDDCIDLVAALAHSRRISLPPIDELEGEPPCDAVALVRAVRGLLPGVRGDAKAEIKTLRRRLRALMGCGAELPNGQPDRNQLLTTVLCADPRAAHVPRVRKQRVTWAAGSTELSLALESRAQQQQNPEALVVLETHTSGVGKRRRSLATRASAVDLRLLAKLDLGEARVGAVSLKGRRLVARVERVLAGKVIRSEEVTPRGDVAIAALVRLLLEERLFRKAIAETRARLARHALCQRLAKAPGYEHFGLDAEAAVPTLEQWVRSRVEELGFESGEDLALLSEDDFLLDDVGAEIRPTLDAEFPVRVEMGDCSYRVDYDFEKRQVILSIVRGSRKKPPPLSFLPKFRGFRICVEAGGSIIVLRQAGR